MTVSRRDFLKQSGAALAVIPVVQDCPASNLPQADGSIRELAMLALDAAKSAGATYADVRISRAQSSPWRRARIVSPISPTATRWASASGFWPRGPGASLPAAS